MPGETDVFGQSYTVPCNCQRMSQQTRKRGRLLLKHTRAKVVTLGLASSTTLLTFGYHMCLGSLPFVIDL